MNQLHMFDEFDRQGRTKPPLPAHSDQDTSLAAAEAIADHVSELAELVLVQILTAGGLTCDEVEQRLGMKHQTASARIRELVLAGKVVKSSQRRATRSGRSAAVWKSTGGGR